MLPTLLSLPFALPSFALPASALPRPLPEPVVQEEVEDEREDVAAWVEALERHVKKRGEEDAQAIAILDRLVQEAEVLGPEDRETVIEALDDVLGERRVQRGEEEGAGNAIYVAAATALGEMGGEEAAEVLADWIDHKRHRDDLALQRSLILALGRIAHEEGLDPLVDLLKHHEPAMQAAAAEALGNYETAESETRKDVFVAILKQIVPLYNEVTTEPRPDPVARARLDAVAGPMISTLRRLSGFDARDPNDFQSWWNDHKKDDWDA